MSRSRPNAPFVFTAAFAILVVLLMTGLLPSPVMTADLRCSDEYRPPELPYDVCKTAAAQTAVVQTATTLGTAPSGGGGGGGGGGGSPVSQPAANTTATLTATTSVSATAGTPTVTTPTRAATAPPAATPTAAAGQSQPGPTPTPTAPIVPEGVATLVCIPGSTVRLVGEAPPGTALLAFFDERPVGGGFARGDGAYTIDLLIGDERPGTYLVEVRSRGELGLIGQFGCEVPSFTVTPTLEAGG